MLDLGSFTNFYRNFLGNRNFNIRLECTISDYFEQEMGVPQGSILSVTVFSIKINSLAEVLRDGMQDSLNVDDCYLL